MSKFDSKKAIPRFSFIAILMTLIAVAVLGKTLYIMTAKHDFWMQVADLVKVDSLSTLPVRGNILSCDGQLMASSLPQYKLFVDFRAIHTAEKDSLFEVKLDSICDGLNAIFPERSLPSLRRTCLRDSKNRKPIGLYGRDA